MIVCTVLSSLCCVKKPVTCVYRVRIAFNSVLCSDRDRSASVEVVNAMHMMNKNMISGI